MPPSSPLCGRGGMGMGSMASANMGGGTGATPGGLNSMGGMNTAGYGGGSGAGAGTGGNMGSMGGYEDANGASWSK